MRIKNRVDLSMNVMNDGRLAQLVECALSI